jgi:hypothetical protein
MVTEMFDEAYDMSGLIWSGPRREEVGSWQEGSSENLRT